MSAALHRSGVFKSKAAKGNQDNLFVDSDNVKLLEEQHDHEAEKPKGCCSCNMTPFVLMLALCVHAIFEGIALGLMTNPQSAFDLMVAIFLHKFAEAFALSISIGRAFEDNFKIVFWLIFMFSFATPLGCTIGILLGEAPMIVDVTFTSLAAGTFLYISCSEVVVEEFALPGGRWVKLFAFLFGAAIIACLWFLDS